MSKKNIDRFFGSQVNDEFRQAMQGACFTSEENLAYQRETLAGFEDDLDQAQARVFVAIQDLNTAYEAYGQELLHVTELRARVKKLADRA